MYFVVLHGHGTSASPLSSGAPTECTALTQAAPVSMTFIASEPARVMTPIDMTT